MGDDPNLAAWYVGYRPDDPYPIPLVDRSRMKADYRPQRVAFGGEEPAGTIVVDIDQRFLYLVQEDGQALRYGIGVGREGFSWKGKASIGRKEVWPSWRPTKTMVGINPDLPRFMPGGLGNPLGARALYLYQNGHDILFRLHGTTEPWTIGQAVSSGCVRLLDEDIADLYGRVEVGTDVIVRHTPRIDLAPAATKT
jgi:lipoprotein-anchoring transpeptidase ErfK/SrfK